MKVQILFFFFTLLSSCSNEEKSISGEVTGIGSSKVYLVNAINKTIKIDSSIFDGNKFHFNLKNVKEPFLASIIYFDENARTNTLMFKNEKLSDNKKNIGTSAFMVEDGPIKIEGKWKPMKSLGDEELLSIKGARQNDYFFNNMSSNLAKINGSSVESRNKSLERVKKEISQNSWSFYLLNQIWTNKDSYEKEELTNLLELFDERVQSSFLALELKKYIFNRREIGSAAISLSAKDINNNLIENINKKGRINMLIFWASWCKPCRIEIPQLKDIRKITNSRDIYMASISIDNSSKNWVKALSEEKMTWDQFLIPEKDLVKIQAQYRFSSIPFIIITDKNGKEIKRYLGYNKQNHQEILGIINTLNK